jgi:hypothetical protein
MICIGIYKFGIDRIFSHLCIMINRILTLVKKCIPTYIEIRSLYWVEYGKQVNADLSEIYLLIDKDKYKEAHELIDLFDKKYNHSFVPEWVDILISDIYRAKSLLVMLETQLED